MKRFIGILCSVLLCGTIFTSFSPSLDGRAVVADKDVLPQGLFARAFGYLPGDSISVTSLSTKQTVDILVIGAIPAEEGIAILLSPEAAVELGLSKDSNNVVKITKRTGQLDEAVAGTAVIGSAIEDVSSYDEEIDSDEDLAADKPYMTDNNEDSDPFDVTTEVVAEEIIPEEEEVAKTSTDPDAELVEDDDIVSSLIEEDPKETVASVFDEQNDSFEEGEVAEETEKVTVIKPTEDVVAEADAEKTDAKPYTVIDNEDVIAPEYVEADDLAELDDKKEKVADPFDEDLNAVGKYDNSYSPVESDELVSENSADSDSAVCADKTEEVAEIPAVETDSGDEVYEPIVLVPADANPPVKSEAEKSETVAESADSTVVPEKKIASADGIDIEKYKVSSMADLEKGKFYVQIAMLGDESNIRATISKYGKQYPIALVPLANGKGYQFLIGSLSMDEYGTVLNRFRSYGYRDAFLRKIK
ncbi:MAG: hypothetical protein IJL70_00815 [Treponema sp.]|nr:hypothetical protein [Treponema sp.]